MQDDLANRIGQLDQPLRTLAQNVTQRGQGRFLFILLAHNASKLVQQLTELNGEGDIVTGEKIVGGDYVCVHTPALTSHLRAAGSETQLVCSIYNLL